MLTCDQPAIGDAIWLPGRLKVIYMRARRAKIRLTAPQARSLVCALLATAGIDYFAANFIALKAVTVSFLVVFFDQLSGRFSNRRGFGLKSLRFF
jgi:hypothetical protein